MESFTWDGTEASLYNLLMWWGRVCGFEHSEDCDGDVATLHCCFGLPYKRNALIGATARPSLYGEEIPIYFMFTEGKRTGKKYDMRPGDIIFYQDGKFSYKESLECVVISQDWP